MSVLRLLAVVIGMVVSCTGCSPATPDTQAANTQAASDATSRPRDINLDGLDPCSVLTPTQLRNLGLNRPPYGSTSYSNVYGGQVARCSMIGSSPSRTVGASLTLVTSVGVERFDDPTHRLQMTTTRVSGFSTVIVHPNSSTSYCLLAVDVAPHQLVEIQFSDVANTPPISQDDLCQAGLHVAQAVTSTLLTR